MSQSYVGEIRMFAGNFAPNGWALCWGQLVPIAENEALYALIGTTYGGDGTSTFALPNLQSRIPMQVDGTHLLGQIGGTEVVTLIGNQIPSHSHLVSGKDGGSVTSPEGAFPGVVASNIGASAYESATPPSIAMANDTIGFDGGNQPHSNIQPYLVINFIISLYGVYPSQN
jgi:microcystin-dependent protein